MSILSHAFAFLLWLVTTPVAGLGWAVAFVVSAKGHDGDHHHFGPWC